MDLPVTVDGILVEGGRDFGLTRHTLKGIVPCQLAV
jgi:hypothetical protein